MNLFNIFTEIENIDADAVERINHYSRRQMFRLGAKAVAAAAPVVMATVGEAYSQGASGMSAQVNDVLNFALTLEYLEDEFYKMGLAAAGLIPMQDRAIFMQIGKHETAHVNLLKTVLGGAAVAKPTFKFPAGAFTNYDTFKFLAKAFEDTGVRAYKGQAANLMSNKDILTAALQIHSVEARHAAEVRRLLRIKEWPSEPGEQPDAVYTGEYMQQQAGINLPGIVPDFITGMKIAESFDEPLTKEQVLAIATPFIA